MALWPERMRMLMDSGRFKRIHTHSVAQHTACPGECAWCSREEVGSFGLSAQDAPVLPRRWRTLLGGSLPLLVCCPLVVISC